MDKTARRDARFAGFVDYLKAARPPDVADLPGARLIPADLIDPNPYQPRTHMDEAALDELAASIRAHGVLQPVTVRPRDGRYQLIAGERRWRAAMRAGLTEIPSIENDYDDAAMELFGLMENIQRADLDPIDEAHAYRRLMEHFELSLRDVAERVSKSHTYIAQRLHLLDDPVIEAAVRDGVLSPTVALSIARVADPTQRQDLIDRARAGAHITVEEARATRKEHASAPTPTVPVVETNFTASATPTRQSQHAERQDTMTVAPIVETNFTASTTIYPDSEDDPIPNPTVGQSVPSMHQDDEQWVKAINMQTVALFQVGNGRANRDQVRSALWADLEALDG